MGHSSFFVGLIFGVYFAQTYDVPKVEKIVKKFYEKLKDIDKKN